MKLFLNYYDGSYKAEEFYILEIVHGVPYYGTTACKIGDEFEIPCKEKFIKGRIVPIHTVLGKGNNGKWYFKGFENEGTAEQFLCRKI